MSDKVSVSSDLIQQAAVMLADSGVSHPIVTLVEFDDENEAINLIDETTGEVYCSHYYGEDL